MIHLGPTIGSNLVRRTDHLFSALVVGNLPVQSVGLPRPEQRTTSQVGRGSILAQTPSRVLVIELKVVVLDLVVRQFSLRTLVLTEPLGSAITFEGQ